MFRLDGKKALVTGATGGIGGAILNTLYSAGAIVVATGTNESVLTQLSKEYADRVRVIRSDLTNISEVETLFDKAENLVGDIDILVCNAGICRDNLAIRMKDEEWEMVLNLNLSVPFKLNRSAIKRMIKRRYGRIINITSIVGFTGNIGQANYSASKAGIVAMSKSIALEVATRGITVNCVAPGFIDTAMVNSIKGSIKETLITKIPLGRVGSSQEIANAVLYLSSEESGYITGNTLHINGGMAMY